VSAEAGAPESSPVAAIRDARRIAIQAGSAPHRYTSLWAVVVGERVFIRSWSVKERSWYRTLLVEPHGVMQLKQREIRFRAVPARSERVRAAVDRAYIAKYDHPGDLPYVKDMTGPKSRATTTELVLAPERGSKTRAREPERRRASVSGSRTERAPRSGAASRRRIRSG
jgi:hypothetical protein